MYGLIVFLIILAISGYWLYRQLTRVVLLEKGGEVITVRRLHITPQTVGIFVGLLILLLIAVSIRIVPVGHALVKFNVITKKFSYSREGLTFVPPFIFKTYMYDMRRLEYTMSSRKGEGKKPNIDDSLWSPTKEGLQVGIDLTCWYRINPDKLIELHQRIGPDFEEKVVRPAIRSVVRHVISEYPIMDVYSAKRKLIQDEIYDKIKSLLGPDGITVEQVVLRDVHFTPDFSKAIEEKQIAQQEAERMKYVLEKEQMEAKRKQIEAEGKARAIEIVSKELKKHPEYVNYLYVDKLSDKVQVIISDQRTILDLKGILKSSK
jgi:regulator of protease activity HflC (stomatin/prohibitin superfamily)